MLLDLEADPTESENLVAGPAHAAERLRLAGAVLAWRQAHDNGTLAGTVLTADGPRTVPRHG